MNTAVYSSIEEWNVARRRQLNLLRASGFSMLLANALMGTFESYWLKELQFSNEFIGAYLTTISAVSLGANLFWGWLADHGVGAARVSRIGCWLFGLVSLLFPLAQTESLFLLYAALKGVFATMAFSMMPLMVAAVAAPGEQGKTYGQYRIFGTYGFLTATVLLPFVLKDVELSAFGLQLQSIQIMFVIAAAATVLAGIPLHWYRAPVLVSTATGATSPAGPAATAAAATSDRRAPGGLRAVLAQPEMAGYLAAYFFFALANPALFGYLSVYAKDLGADPQFVGLLSCCLGIVGLTCLRVMGWVTDRTQPRYILWLAFAAQPLRALTAACVTENYLWLMLPQVFHIFTWAGPEVAKVYFIGRLVGDENRGKALGLAMSVEVLGGIVGAPICGWLSTAYGYPTMYLFAAGASSLGFAIFSGCLWRMRSRTAASSSDNRNADASASGCSAKTICQPAA